eukprot:3418101-Prymnesium_polylepis.1
MPPLPYETTTWDIGYGDVLRRVGVATVRNKDVPSAANSEVSVPAKSLNVVSQQEVQPLIMQAIKEITGVENIDQDVPLFDVGIDSLTSTDFASHVSDMTGTRLPSLLVFEHSTARAVVACVISKVSQSGPSTAAYNGDTSAALKEQAPSYSGAVHRWPAQCTSSSAFRSLLGGSVDTVARVPSARWTLDDVCKELPSNDEVLRRTDNLSTIVGVDLFDNNSFGISPAEALMMDPQQRHLLEIGYASLHAVGQRRASLVGADTAFFLGVERPDWPFLHVGTPAGQLSVYAATSDTISVAGGRMSFTLGLQGACVTLDTACSASIVAAHSATLELRDRACSTALVASVKLHLHWR